MSRNPQSRLDRGRFTAGDVQTLARFVGVTGRQLRRLTEAAVVIASLPRKRRQKPDDLTTADVDEEATRG